MLTKEGSVIEERKQPFLVDQEKFVTQKEVTYFLLVLFAAVTACVMWQNDQSERSMVLQTVINLTLLAVGYWVGASKQGQDAALSNQRIAESAPTAVRETTKGGDPIVAGDVKVEAAGDVTIQPGEKK